MLGEVWRKGLRAYTDRHRLQQAAALRRFGVGSRGPRCGGCRRRRVAGHSFTATVAVMKSHKLGDFTQQKCTLSQSPRLDLQVQVPAGPGSLWGSGGILPRPLLAPAIHCPAAASLPSLLHLHAASPNLCVSVFTWPSWEDIGLGPLLLHYDFI